MKIIITKFILITTAVFLAGSAQTTFAGACYHPKTVACWHKWLTKVWCPPKKPNWCKPPSNNWCKPPPSDNGCDLPTNKVCFVSSGLYPGSSYVDLTLSGLQSGFALTNGTYSGWCIAYYEYFGLGYQYCDALLLKSTDPSLPAHVQELWGIINYILNHKQGTPKDVQNAIWYFTDGIVPPVEEQTAEYLALVEAAESQSSFVPGAGEIFAVIVYLPDDPAAQNLIIEFACPPSNPGTGTPGYWKNHPLSWPVSTINLGGVNYSILQAIYIMKQATKKDKTYNLAEHLIAAKLNVLKGNDSSCVADAIADADAFLAAFPIGSGVAASSAAWQNLGGPLLSTLADYNEGKLCAPPRD